MAFLEGFDPYIAAGRRGFNTAAAPIRAVNNTIGQTAAGRAFKQGFGEVFGMEYTKAGESLGFAGLAGSKGHRAYNKLRARKVGRFKSVSGGMRAQANAFKNTGGVRGVGRAIKGMGFFGVLGKVAGPAFVGVDAYMGYREGGVLGAAGNLVESGIIWGGMKAAAVVVGSAALWTTAAVSAGAVGGYMWGEAATDYRKRLQETEFIPRDVTNTIQGAYTDRARALNALNNSALNARMSIGNEAQLLHSTYSSMNLGGRV